MRHNIGIFVLLLILVVGCGGNDSDIVASPPTAAPPTARPTITPRPSVTPLPTEAPTDVPTATSTPLPLDVNESFEFAEFTFVYSDQMVREVAAFYEAFEAGTITDQPEKVRYDSLPETVIFEVVPSLANGRRGSVRIVTVTTDEGDRYFELGLEDLSYLDQLRDALSDEDVEEASELALRGIPIAETVGILESPNGMFVRGLFYDGAPDQPFNANSLTYRAALISNIQYHVAVNLPVAFRSPEARLAAESADSVEAAIALLSEDAAWAFEPALQDLDLMVQGFDTPQNAIPTSTPIPPTATSEPTEPVAPTETPIPEVTEAPTVPAAPTVDISEIPPNDPNCSHFLVFTADITVPDGEAFPPGAIFEKTWEAENKGSCTLSAAYQLAPLAETMSVVGVDPVPVLTQNEIGEFTVRIRAPEEPGRYVMNWQLFPPTDGSINLTDPFGRLYVEIVVDPEAPEPTETP